MSHESDPEKQGDDGQGGPFGTLTDDPIDEAQFGNDKAEQTARTIRQYITDFLERLSLTDWITAIGTGVIAAATIWNVIVVTSQLGEMQTSGVDTHNLVVATQNLKDAAIAGNKLSALANRPWIGLTNYVLESPKAAGDRLKMSLTVSNAGKSPADIVSFLVGGGTGTLLGTNPAYRRDTVSRTVLVPNGNANETFSTDPFDPADIAAIKSGVANYYVYGEVKYGDIGGKPEHLTHFCIMWLEKRGQWGICPYYNEAK